MERIEGQALQSPLRMSGFGFCFSHIWFDSEEDGNKFNSGPICKS